MQIGLNPYGLTYTVGLQALGTPRANPEAIGLDGFVRIVRDLRGSCIELDWRWLTPMSAGDLSRLRDTLQGLTPITSFWLSHQPGETLDEAVRCSTAVGARLLRLHLTPVLEGARASWGARWDEMLTHARDTLRRESPRLADAGLPFAIENHQDLGSEELLAIVDALGDHAGIVLDTGNPYAVGEDPVAFTRRAAHRIRHLHLKDYVAQFTSEGYRLVRCAIGDGTVPFAEIAAVLEPYWASLTASVEPAALEARHIRLFTAGWWRGYPSRQASELGSMLGRLCRQALPENADCRTPWEQEAAGPELVAYELDHIRRSVDNLRAMGWWGGGEMPELPKSA
jgi:sugar phosphate isomerase/epimerase